MHFFVASLLLLGTFVNSGQSAVLVENPIDLRPAVNEILSIIDQDTISNAMIGLDREIQISCMHQEDPEILPYLQGEDFKSIHLFLWTNPQFLEIIHFIEKGGYPEIYDAFNSMYDFFGLPYQVDANGPIENFEPVLLPSPLVPCDNATFASVETAQKAILSSFPEAEDFIQVVVKLIRKDENVKAFIKMLQQPEKKEFFNDFYQLPQVQKLIKYAETKGKSEMVYEYMNMFR